MKRAFDIVASLFGLVLLAPLLVAIALVLRITLGNPVLFRQRRPGLQEKPFTLYKFRTMREARDWQSRLIPDDQRTTRFGRFLRRTSLDELPELWNVLRGDMSLVGPRPLLMGFLEHYTPEQRRRHAVRPGITGWAQVNGRNNLSWEEKLSLDLWYVNEASMLLDLKILRLTLWVVLSRKGIAYTENCLPPALSNLSSGEILLREGEQT